MRILRVISTVNLAHGGPIEGVRQSARSLARQGITVEVASLDAPEDPWVKDFDGVVHALGPAKSGYRYSERFVPWLREHAHEYDHVVVSGLWQYPTLGVWRALRKVKPYHVFPHGMLDPWFKHAYPVKHLKKSLYWLLFEYRILKDAKAVLFTTEEERELAARSFRPYSVRGRVVNYGTAAPPPATEHQLESFYERCPAARGKRILLFLSRLHPKKGCDLLIRAFAEVAPNHPDLHLVLAGPDQEGTRQGLEEECERLNLSSRISWPGMLKGDEKWGAYRAADAFCLPSHQENFGIVVAEALACGVPVLISNKVNIWREIEADGAGIVEPDDAAGARRLLERWLALSDEERATMRESAERCFSNRFEITQAANSLVEALQTP